MLKLANLLKHFEGRKKGVRLELVTGRRPRMMFDAEGGRERGEVKNLGDEALTEDDLLSLCEEAGAGSRLDSIDRGPANFPYFDGVSSFRVTLEMRGRDIAAVFVPRAASVTGAAAVAKKPSIPPRNRRDDASRTERPTRQDLAAVEANARKTLKPPRGEAGPPPSSSRSSRAVPVQRASVAPKRSVTPRPAQVPPPNRQTRATVGGMPKQRAIELTRRASEPARPPAPRISIASGRPAFAALAWPTDHSSAARLSQLLSDGQRNGASDLHVVAKHAPLFRVAGELRPIPGAKPVGEDAVLALVPDTLRAEVDRKGGADFALDVPKVGRFRVNMTLTLRGPKVSLRFLPREVPTFASLGFGELLVGATEHHQGLVVIAGPSGHGKTSTLAAMVDHINGRSAHHIITVEDPVEIVHASKQAIVSQREIGAQAKSFARALKGALRQDPDVIVVGELRDTETVRMALSASETGHLVLGTMNTPSAAATIEALIDLFPPGDQPQVRSTLSGGLKYIVSQRLVPKADGTGCAVALETLPGSLPLWNMIRDQKTFQLPSLMQRGRGLGIIRLNDSLADLVNKEIVTKAAALDASPSPDELEALLRGHAEPPPQIEKQAPKAEVPGSLLERAGAFFSRKGD